jgi:PTS system mannitol-specific IIC component
VKELGAPNQIVAALMLAPLSAYLFKQFEKLYINKIKAGYEMIVKNFSLALSAIFFGLIAFFA